MIGKGLGVVGKGDTPVNCLITNVSCFSFLCSVATEWGLNQMELVAPPLKVDGIQDCRRS
jgi:hypothetical protein